MAWAVSGSVSLELMMEDLPTVILYKLNRFDLWIARPFIKAKYITLVNLLADEELMPEYLTERDVSDELSGWARTWLDDPVARDRAIAKLAALRHQVALPGASQRAAATSSRGWPACPRYSHGFYVPWASRVGSPRRDLPGTAIPEGLSPEFVHGPRFSA